MPMRTGRHDSNPDANLRDPLLILCVALCAATSCRHQRQLQERSGPSEKFATEQDRSHSADVRLRAYQNVDSAPVTKQIDLTRDLLASSGETLPQTSPVHLAAVFKSAAESKKLNRTVTSSEPVCYRDGCLVITHYSSERDLKIFDDLLTHTEVFAKWPGVKHRTSPEALTDGGTRAGWVFFAFGD
jgi:hypothetical protein